MLHTAVAGISIVATLYFGAKPLIDHGPYKHPFTITMGTGKTLKENQEVIPGKNVHWSLPISFSTITNLDLKSSPLDCIDSGSYGRVYVYCYRATYYEVRIPKEPYYGKAKECSISDICSIYINSTPNPYLKFKESSKFGNQLKLIETGSSIELIDRENTGPLKLSFSGPAKKMPWFKPVIFTLEGQLDFYYSTNRRKPNATQKFKKEFILADSRKIVAGFYGLVSS